MKALIFNDVGSIVLQDVEEPKIQEPTDVIVKITTTTICGTDLHMVRGTIPMMQPGTILGHEGVGLIEKTGHDVKHFTVGDRVIVPSTIACGKCDYCIHGYYSQCDNANPHAADAGTAFYGGPVPTGPFQGMQAEKVRVPFADASLIKVPDDLKDEDVILLSDILPTAYMGVEFAEVTPDDTVAVFGCGPVGQLVIACLKQRNVQEIYAIDHIPFRLQRAQQQGAYTINFDTTDPVQELKKITHGKGPTKIIDAVGIDAEQPKTAALRSFLPQPYTEFNDEVKQVAPKINPHDGNWVPGNGPSQVLQWAVEAIAKNGTLSIIGVYTPLLTHFPIGHAMGKNLTIRMGNCNHRRYIPELLEWIRSGQFHPREFLTQYRSFNDIVDSYKRFDKREEGWLKVVLSLTE